MNEVNAEDRIALARRFMAVLRKGACGTLPRSHDNAPNRAIAASIDGALSMIEACLDGDLPRAMARAEDMPMRMQLANVGAASQRNTEGAE